MAIKTWHTGGIDIRICCNRKLGKAVELSLSNRVNCIFFKKKQATLHTLM